MAKQLKKTLEQLAELYGEKTVFKLGEDLTLAVDWQKTGIPQIDSIMGGGFPKGRITEVWGAEGSGKTTLALLAAAKAQVEGFNVAYIDMEHAINPGWATKLGVNINELYFAQPSYAEEALDIVEKLLETEQFAMIVVDSVAAMCPKVELEGEAGEAHVGLHSRLMSQAMRRLTAKIANSKTCLVFINQIRMKIGVMWGNPETTTGGNALKYYASIRLKMTRGKIKEEKEVPVSCQVKVVCIKNKVADPFQETEMTICFDGKVL
jgi:recombination protein RecA